MKTEKKKVYILSFTHWDREWYRPFQEFRFRLVNLVDELIDVLEKPNYRCFFFDGQTIVLEDYLEIRPHNRAKIAELIKSGKLIVGPWYTMPDLNLSSGESIIRNLARGCAIAKCYGGDKPKVGHMCDIFGFPGQIPQIMKGFGIENLSLYRGLADGTPNLFDWEGLDGTVSTVHKFHPDISYGTFFFLTRYPFRLKEGSLNEKIENVRKFLAELPQDQSVILLMDGTDFIAPTYDTVELINELNKALPEYLFIHSDYADYFESAKERGKVKAVKGPIYTIGKEGAMNRLLKNVLSSHPELKRANERCDTLLHAVAEPLSAFLNISGCDGRPPQNTFAKRKEDFFNYARKLMLQNLAHDSICGCSVTATHEDNANRFKQALEVISTCIDDDLGRFAYHIDGSNLKGKSGYLLVMNMSPVELNETVIAEIYEKKGTSQQNYRIYDDQNAPIGYSVLNVREAYKKQQGFTNSAVFTECTVTEVGFIAHVPAYSYMVYSYDSLVSVWDEEVTYRYLSYYPPERRRGSMRTGEYTINNGVLKIDVDPILGTLSVENLGTKQRYENVLLLEDRIDDGDGWNYVPTVKNAADLGGCADVVFECDTPDLIRIIIHKKLRSLTGEKDSIVKFAVTVRRGISRLNIKAETKNFEPRRRLRTGLCFGGGPKTYITSVPFSLQEWPVALPDSSDFDELETGVVPNQGLVYVSDGERCAAVYTRGIYECEVSDRPDHPIYITLFRSFMKESWKLPHEVVRRYPEEQVFEFAFDFLPGCATARDAYANSIAFRTGVISYNFDSSNGTLPPMGSFMKIAGGGVVSAFYETDGEYILRIFAHAGGAEGEVSFALPVRSAELVNFSGEHIAHAEVSSGKLQYKLPKHGIQTFKLGF